MSATLLNFKSSGFYYFFFFGLSFVRQSLLSVAVVGIVRQSLLDFTAEAMVSEAFSDLGERIKVLGDLIKTVKFVDDKAFVSSTVGISQWQIV